MRGQLTDHPLAELIREMSSKNLSGTLRLEHERARTAVYFEEGEVVFAASNLRTLRLRGYLTKTNLVTEKELSTFGDGVSDLGLGSKLVANRRITQEQFDGLLKAMVQDVLRVALLWTEGAWEFDERARLADPVRVNVSIASLLREAGQRLPLKFVSQRFRNPRERMTRATNVSLDNSFLASESFLLSRLDSPTTLDELVAVSGLRDLDTYQLIYGLALSGAIEREYWHHAFRADAAKPKAPAPVAVEAGAAETTGSWGGLSSESELELFLERLDRAETHYEILDLPPTADADEIKSAYYSLARKYHPDRFHLKSGTKLHARLSTSFARITQAYETLMKPDTRAVYDATLERTRRFADEAPKPPPPKAGIDDDIDVDSGNAEYNFREGCAALKQGNINAAIHHLAACARVMPSDPRYRAYYGRALGASERTRRMAESEIQAAIRLEPSNATYRAMLAELFFDLKFGKRAEAELDRALALDRDNPVAVLLQRKMQRARKIG